MERILVIFAILIIPNFVFAGDCEKITAREAIVCLENKIESLSNDYLILKSRIDSGFQRGSRKFKPENTFTSIDNIKLPVISAVASNSYSAEYNASKTIDSNLNSYWSTLSGKVLDTKIEYYFEESKLITELHLYSPKKGSGYTQPSKLLISFYDDGDDKVSSQVLNLRGPYKSWQKIKIEPVTNVSKIVVQINTLTTDIANYLTIHEIAFYGN